VSWKINDWVVINENNTVTVIVPQSEMGQGIVTALTAAVAEELGAAWTDVSFETPSFAPVYRNPGLGVMITGGSYSMLGWWEPMRKAGADARARLTKAAARRWGANSADCRTENCQVIHAKGGQILNFCDVAAEAASLPALDHPARKPPDKWLLLGHSLPRLDSTTKVYGQAKYGADVRLPGMVYAAVRQPDLFGARVVSCDTQAARNIKGIVDVLVRPGYVAVLADSWWLAQKTLDTLKPVFEGGDETVDDAWIETALRAGLDEPGREIVSTGVPPSPDARLITSQYQVPFLAHAAMEPMNCTAWVTADDCQVWAPTQAQEAACMAAANASGLGIEKMTIHTTYIGGGFGRKSMCDAVGQAVTLAKLSGRPVQVQWSRQEDLTHDYYRHACCTRLQAALSPAGELVSYEQKVSCSFCPAHVIPGEVQTIPDWFHEANKSCAMQGTAWDGPPYEIARRRVEVTWKATPVPTGFWRSVGHSMNIFFNESFIDEIAAATGDDPLALRLRLLSGSKRHLAVLELAASKAGWNMPPDKGRARGIALHNLYDGVIATVAEISFDKATGNWWPERLTCAADCGTIVNPQIVIAQLEGGLVFGLNAALHEQVTLDSGEVQQRTLTDYPQLRLQDCPQIDVHLVPASTAPTGVGELATPSIAPALANAIASCGAVRPRRLPLPHSLSFQE
jgi:isoquinoline 1-oxidoreductase beta subunit